MEMSKKVNKNMGTNFQSHYLYSIYLIGLNLCYFTLLYIYLGNEIRALHNRIKSLEDPNICKSSEFYSLKKRENAAKKAIGKETGIVSMLATLFIRIYTNLHMPQGVHIIAYYVWAEK